MGLLGLVPMGKGQGARQDEKDQHSAIPMEPRALQALNKGEPEFGVPGPHITPRFSRKDRAEGSEGYFSFIFSPGAISHVKAIEQVGGPDFSLMPTPPYLFPTLLHHLWCSASSLPQLWHEIGHQDPPDCFLNVFQICLL
uniref:Uncharacterized protein n=1 Tax=Molossus molossus TaxID=27622 RepID=A0A7J8FTV0_MOLMO|nr:hypothetical protein HJG59_008436 [Molossus molossus]